MYYLQNSKDLDHLLQDIGDRHIVMLGEASHGTHEFYTWRAAISRRLIMEKGFNFIAVEGDWPDCYHINRFIKGYKDAGEDIEAVLSKFDRWPTWMWGNWEIAGFAEWLRENNEPLSSEKKTGFYGLDVYSLWDSMKAMMHYLETEDPVAAKSVRKAIQCFEPFNENESQYARYSLNDVGCSEEVISLLKEIRLKAQFLDGDREAGFNTEQNALIAVNAEKYYRSMIGFDNESWNIRDKHMMETMERLLAFHGKNAKAIVWAHNTHIGDARATGMSAAGMVNIGELVRKKYGKENAYLAGFATYQGTVIAGEEWGAPMQEMTVPKAHKGSLEYTLHQQDDRDRYFLISQKTPQELLKKIEHRAIGVVYEPAL